MPLLSKLIWRKNNRRRHEVGNMAGLKELRNRIEAIRSTEKITAAMKMVAASRLRRAQDVLAKSAAYRANLYNIAGRVWGFLQKAAAEDNVQPALPLLCRGNGESNKYLLVVLSSDRGLCGSYNAMIARAAMNRIEELKAAGKEVQIICLGQRGYNALKRHYAALIVRTAESAANKGVFYDEAEALAAEVVSMFMRGEVDVCEIVYSHFRSAMSRDVDSRQVLPLDPGMLVVEIPAEMSGDAYFESEPDNELLLEKLMPLVFRETIFDIMINSQASEQGARMTSMDNATRNAGDMISRLTLRYNRLRQTAITTELVEIIAGAEAI